MKKILFLLILPILALPLHAGRELYEKKTPPSANSELDHIFFAKWQQNGIPVPREASDAVLLRRVTLALTGKLPPVAAVRQYLQDADPDKYEKTVDKLLATPEFADFWTMKFADTLRIKSEFPINLWPNAVYAYSKLVRDTLRKNRPLNIFVRNLLSAAGSNFRDPGVNFCRANAEKTPSGMAKGALLALAGIRYDKLPPDEQKHFAAMFSGVAFKKTGEWKEEILYTQVYPDRRQEFAAYLFEPNCSRFAVAMAHRAAAWLFGRGIDGTPDDLTGRKFSAPLPEMAALRNIFKRGYEFKTLVRAIVMSAPFRVSGLPPAGADAKTIADAAAATAIFPATRLDAEVLEDAFADLSGMRTSYESVIPEPFTYTPEEKSTVSLADGSIGSSFLTIFGRPARDSGLWDERNNEITAKQRLWLFNSAHLYRRLGRVAAQKEMQKMNAKQRIEFLYLTFFGRIPARQESDMLLKEYDSRPRGPQKWRFFHELCWLLANSREFLYQH